MIHFNLTLKKGLGVLDSHIETLRLENHIDVDTVKNKVDNGVRKELAWAYSQKAEFYKFSETPLVEGCMERGNDNTFCFSNCCFEGDNGTINASLHNKAQAVANLRQAMEWDPMNTDYAAECQRLDAAMKTPIFNITHVSHYS